MSDRLAFAAARFCKSSLRSCKRNGRSLRSSGAFSRRWLRGGHVPSPCCRVGGVPRVADEPLRANRCLPKGRRLAEARYTVAERPTAPPLPAARASCRSCTSLACSRVLGAEGACFEAAIEREARSGTTWRGPPCEDDTTSARVPGRSQAHGRACWRACRAGGHEVRCCGLCRQAARADCMFLRAAHLRQARCMRCSRSTSTPRARPGRCPRSRVRWRRSCETVHPARKRGLSWRYITRVS